MCLCHNTVPNDYQITQAILYFCSKHNTTTTHMYYVNQDMRDIDACTSHPATFLGYVLPVGICGAGLSMKLGDLELQLTPAFIGGRGCPIACL
ncbi:cyclin-dependent kinase F-4 [Trifolium repens]|nr:cyclin-dependent kinase F-4 [Trifolium repens]